MLCSTVNRFLGMKIPLNGILLDQSATLDHLKYILVTKIDCNRILGHNGARSGLPMTVTECKERTSGEVKS